MFSTFLKHGTTVIEVIEDTKFDVEKTSTNDHIWSHRRQN